MAGRDCRNVALDIHRLSTGTRHQLHVSRGWYSTSCTCGVIRLMIADLPIQFPLNWDRTQRGRHQDGWSRSVIRWTQISVDVVFSSTCRRNKTVPTRREPDVQFQSLYVGKTLIQPRNPAIAEGPRDAGVPVEIW